MDARLAAEAPAAERSRAVLTVQAGTGVAVVAFCLSTILRARGTTSSFFDGFVGNAGYAGCTALCLLRAIKVRAQRLGWLIFSFSLTLFTIGTVLFTTVVQYWTPTPYPSIADVFFLAFYPFAYLGVGLLVRAEVPRGGAVWLDGLVAAFGAGALETVFVIGRITRIATGSHSAIATYVAYPVGDLVLFVTVIAVFAVQDWRPQPQWWLLGGGLVIFAVADTVYVLRVLTNTYATGTPLDSLWLIGTFLMSLAAWAAPRPGIERRESRQPILVPVFFTLTSVGIVAGDGVVFHASRLGVALATLTILLAVARLGRAYHQVSELAASRREAVTDVLTGLGNLRLLQAAIERLLATRQATAAALLLIDVEGLSGMADAHGRAARDDFLIITGNTLSRSLRPGDIVARTGGHEFAAILLGARDEEAHAAADRIASLLSEPMTVHGISARLSVTVGIAALTGDADDTAELLRRADVALSEARSAGTTSAVYAHATDRTRDRLELLRDLRQAVAEQTLELAYQPQVALPGADIHGVEVLLRWRHPVRGSIAPDVFIPMAEQAMLMNPLTHFVLSEALRQCAQWQRDGVDIRVAVNLSATNLLENDLPDRIHQLLTGNELAPASLIVEITETTLMIDPERARSVLDRIQSLGVGISVDDFGTGYSSLSYLRDLRVDELKLDRAFLEGIAANPSGRTAAIARSTLQLGHALGIRVLAEGVEDPATLALLTTWGYDSAQGYYLGRPSPAAELDLCPDPAWT